MAQKSMKTSGGEYFGFEQQGRISELLPIALINGILNIVTLTFYRFWAKTKVREYLWGRTQLLGEPMEYTGTGKELFLGFLVVLFAVLLPLGVANYIMSVTFSPDDPVLILFNLLFTMVIFFLIGVAIYRARRYRMSRTVWRGIRGGQTGSAVLYGLKSLGFYLILLPTFGWSYPWQSMNLMSQMMNNTSFGDRAFTFEKGLGPLYRRFTLAWLIQVGVVVVLVGAFWFIATANAQTDNVSTGVSIGPWQIVIILTMLSIPFVIAWYRAGELNYMASRARYEGVNFEFNATAGSLIWLGLGNFLIVIFTLGIGLPFTQLRRFHYFCDRLVMKGEVDFDAIQQSAVEKGEIGEGLADAFDIGAV